MLVKIIEPNFKNVNERGVLLQLVREGWKQVNVVKYKKGVVSGGHYHKYNTECFFVVTGKVELTAWKKNMKEYYFFKEGDMFLIERNVFHTFVYQEDSVLVALYDNGVEMDGDIKDIWSE